MFRRSAETLQTLLGLRVLFVRKLGSRISVKDAETVELPKQGTVYGWVKSVRKQKDVIFIDLNDGSSLQSLQIVAASTGNIPKTITQGCSLMATGNIMESSHDGQKVEMKATELRVMGECDQQAYPFKSRKRHGFEYIRQFPHLRARTKAFSSLLRIRNTATMAMHQFLQERGFLLVHPPVITSSDCEGAGDLFRVMPSRDGPEVTDEFFGCKAYLTVSGQLHVEAIASAMMSAYTFGPIFRAEKSHTRRHLSEFHMLEVETMTTEDGLPDLLQLIEELYKHALDTVLQKNGDDVQLFHDNIAALEVKTSVISSLEKPFKHITYTDAVDVLKEAQEKKGFQFKPEWGFDFKSEHEQYLVAHCGNLPLFVTDFPAVIKPFYARATEDKRNTVSSVDLLVPFVGEVVGGTLREERLEVLQSKLERLNMLEPYQWYLDLRRFGTVPHGGFGLGFERFLQAILGVENIRDVTPFPRFLGSCEM